MISDQPHILPSPRATWLEFERIRCSRVGRAIGIGNSVRKGPEAQSSPASGANSSQVGLCEKRASHTTHVFQKRDR